MKSALVAASLTWLGLDAAINGQSTQTESVLDRVVAQQPNGGPFVYAPPIKDWSEQAVIAVGSAADVVIGFEASTRDIDGWISTACPSCGCGRPGSIPITF